MRRLIILLLLVSLLVVALGSALVVPVTYAQEQTLPDCHMKGGRAMVTKGALLYFKVIIDEALDDDKPSIDLDNDYLCYVPLQAQSYLRMMGENLLFFVYEVLPVSVFDAIQQGG